MEKKIIAIILFIGFINSVNAQTWAIEWQDDCGAGSNYPNNPWYPHDLSGGSAAKSNGWCQIIDTDTLTRVTINRTISHTTGLIRLNWTWNISDSDQGYMSLSDEQLNHQVLFRLNAGIGQLVWGNTTDYYQQSDGIGVGEAIDCSAIIDMDSEMMLRFDCNGNTTLDAPLKSGINLSTIVLFSTNPPTPTINYDNFIVEYNTTASTTSTTTTTTTTTTLVGFFAAEINFDFEMCIDSTYPNADCQNWTIYTSQTQYDEWNEPGGISIFNKTEDATIAQGEYAIGTTDAFLGNVTSDIFKINYNGDVNLTGRMSGSGGFINLCEYINDVKSGCGYGMDNFICRIDTSLGNWVLNTISCGNLYNKNLYISIDDGGMGTNTGADDIMFKDSGGNNLTLLGENQGSSAYSISGYIKNISDDVIANASVFLGDAFENLITATPSNDSGYYEFNLSYPGLYSLSVSQENYGSECLDLISVTGHETINISIYNYNLNFVLADASTGSFVENGFIYAIDVLDNSNYLVCTTNSTGECTILADESTEYQYVASAPGYENYTYPHNFVPICRQNLNLYLNLEEEKSVVVLHVYDADWNNNTYLEGVWIQVFNDETGSMITQNVTNVDGFTEVYLPLGITYRFNSVLEYYENTTVVQYIGLDNEYITIPMYRTYSILQDYQIWGKVYVDNIATSHVKLDYFCGHSSCPSCIKLGIVITDDNGNYSIDVKEGSSCIIDHYIDNISDYTQIFNDINNNINNDIYLLGYQPYAFYVVDNITLDDIIDVSLSVYFNGTLKDNHLVQSFGDYIINIQNNTNVSIHTDHGKYLDWDNWFLTDFAQDEISGYAKIISLQPRTLEDYESEITLQPDPYVQMYNSTPDYVHTIELTVINEDNHSDSHSGSIHATNLEMLKHQAGFTFYLQKGNIYELKIQSSTYTLLNPPFEFVPSKSVESIRVPIGAQESNENSEVNNLIYTDFFNRFAYSIYLLSIVVIIMSLISNISPK